MNTSISNTKMLDNVITILENIKQNKALDDNDDFKSLMSKVTAVAMNGPKKVVKKKKGSNPYTDFVKAKMPELKDSPKGETFKTIGEMWKGHKETEPFIQKTINKPKIVENSKDSNDPMPKLKKTSAYNEFVKVKMPELKDSPKGETFKTIGEMWKGHKETEPFIQKTINKPKIVENSKDSNDPMPKLKKTSAYNEFVKVKMPELKDSPKGEKFKIIGEMWKEYKETNPINSVAQKTTNKPKIVENRKDSNNPIPKLKASTYNEFVKANIPEQKNAPRISKFKIISEMWKTYK
jgi:hypothetical protein